MKITPKNARYGAKDVAKAAAANKFIGRGSPASSTDLYRRQCGDMANCGEYTADDVVFVSVEGQRRGRVPLDVEELQRALAAKATIIADNPANRHRAYNIGERHLAQILQRANYIEEPGPVFSVWRPQ